MSVTYRMIVIVEKQLWILCNLATKKKFSSQYFSFRRKEFSNHLGLKPNCLNCVLIFRLKEFKFPFFHFFLFTFQTWYKSFRQNDQSSHSSVKLSQPTRRHVPPPPPPPKKKNRNIPGEFFVHKQTVSPNSLPHLISILIKRNAVLKCSWLATKS
jgi:hypothetical protein